MPQVNAIINMTDELDGSKHNRKKHNTSFVLEYALNFSEVFNSSKIADYNLLTSL